MCIPYRKGILTALLLAGWMLAPSGVVFGQTSSPAQIGIFHSFTIRPEARVEVPIEIRGVDGLYALDISVHFDPTILQAVGVDPASQGIQMALGNFLDPGLVLFNTVDNVKGEAHFVMTQFAPSEPKSGNGVLLVMYFKGLKEGEAKITLADVQLSTRDGLAIPASMVDAKIKVDKNAPAAVFTPIPVHDATKMIQIPTMGVTPQVDKTVAPTATPSMEKATLVEKTATEIEPIQVETNQSTTGEALGYFMLGNWWIPLVLLLLVIAAGVYLLMTMKRQHK